MRYSHNCISRNLLGCLLLLFSVAACENGNEADTSATKTAASANSDKLILVSGATGRQGGAVARELLSRGYRTWHRNGQG